VAVTRQRRASAPSAPRRVARSPSPVRTVERGSAVAHVYSTLRAEILSLRLAPGSDLDDATLVERLGLSRTPIREALARLAGDGLVVQSPNRGVQVAPINLMDLPRFVEALDLMQRAVLRTAALRRTPKDMARIEAAYEAFGLATSGSDALVLTERNRDFHSAIAEASHNRYLADSYTRLLDEGMRMLSVPFGYDPERGDSAQVHTARVADEHLEMVDAIRSGDAARAEALAASHAELFRARFIVYFEQNLLSDMPVDAPAPRDPTGGD